MKIITFVHTEYHLILFINRLLNEKSKGITHEHHLYLRNQSAQRIGRSYNFSEFNIKISFCDIAINIHRPLSQELLLSIDEIKRQTPDEFVFYQEMDVLMILLGLYWKQKGNTKILLFQDGLKPYNILRYYPLSLFNHHYKMYVWLKKEGYPVPSWLNILRSHKYAFLNIIDEVWLTFPEAYINWNNKKVCMIEMCDINLLKPSLEQVFGWEDHLLKQRSGVILYMHQALHDEGNVERQFIQQLQERFPNVPFYLKPHPLATPNEILGFKEEGLLVIESKLPAELFILNLRNSMIISVNSTSMFLKTESNKYYYLYKYFEKEVKRLQKYNVKKHPSKHIKIVHKLEDLQF